MILLIKNFILSIFGFPQGFLGSLIGGLAGTLGSAIIGDFFGDGNAKDQYERSMDMYQNRYTYTVADMKRAGLNPILAATGGFNVGSGPTISMAQMPTYPDISSSALDWQKTKEAESNTDKIDQETQKVIKDAELSAQRTAESLENTLKTRAEKNLVTAQERKTVQEIQNLQQEINKIMANTLLLENQTDYVQSQTAVEREYVGAVQEQKKLTAANKKLAEGELKRLEYQLSQLKRISDVYSGPVGSALTYVREIMNALGLAPIAGALVGGAVRGKPQGGSITIKNYPKQ